MSTQQKSSGFTQARANQSFGPPLIGALLRMPWEQVLRRMLDRLHERGFDDLDAPHLNLLLYPGPQGARPSELAAWRGMSKQAVNYLLGELERLGYLDRHADPDAGAAGPAPGRGAERVLCGPDLYPGRRGQHGRPGNRHLPLGLWRRPQL